MASQQRRRAMRAVTFCTSPLWVRRSAPRLQYFRHFSTCTARQLPKACISPELSAAPPQVPLSRGSKLVLVGLGNPGSQFENTRHNIGFSVVHEFVRRNGGSAFRTERRFEAGVSQVMLGERMVHVAQPRTFMNASGRSVRSLLKYYDIPRSALLVVSDDMALPLGKLRLRAQGSAGGHNGLRSVGKSLGDRDYARLRVGVGETGEGAAGWRGHVLGKFTRGEMDIVDEAVWDCVEVIEEWVWQEEFQRVVDKLSKIQGRRLGK